MYFCTPLLNSRPLRQCFGGQGRLILRVGHVEWKEQLQIVLGRPVISRIFYLTIQLAWEVVEEG